ncbi:MAG TPA: type II/IV secretion system protein, partial [Opitutaceae bacterium]
MLSPRLEAFFARLRATPNFGSEEELRQLGERHGDTPEIVQAVIESKIVGKDDACRFWADTMNVAYVDPFVSVITDEAIEKIPHEVAKKVRGVGLYIFNGVLTIAMATPDDAETAKRLGLIARIPCSPVFALPREIEDAIAIHYSNEERLEDSLGQLERSNLFDVPDLASDKLAHLAENNALVQILDEIVYYAMRERATDIHIEA